MNSRIQERESRTGVIVSWCSLAASFVLSFATWVDLATFAGFTGSVTVMGMTVALAWAMPVAVDGYVVSALITWTSPVSAPIAAFARKHTYGAAIVGVIAQSTYHGTIGWRTSHSAWTAGISAVIGCLPPLFAAFSVHLRAVTRRALQERQESTRSAPTPEPAPVEPLRATPAPALQAPEPESDSITEELERLLESEREPALQRSSALTEPAPGVVALHVVPAPESTPAPRRSRSAFDAERALQLLRDGAAPKEVAPVLGVHVKTVEKLRRRAIEEGKLQP